MLMNLRKQFIKKWKSSINQALQYVFPKIQKILEENSLNVSTQLNFETGDDAEFPDFFVYYFQMGNAERK
ncbi:conserved hypothetical protein [Capnocytophaga canis]|uniref:Uncharacterized protein n=2 Tax=Capnocytophaga canimorsus TaxID=28188 RepID=F9YPN0_CAPCC|nr:Hypothetical protein Ccan_12600 [Capnocytophaga canimorsus Cc5]CEN45180.1 conserved hypothetical protein [Capnocytophaga canis]